MNSVPPRYFKTSYNCHTRSLMAVVDVGAAFAPHRGERPPPLQRFNALWDTGATATVITRELVNKLSLQPMGAVETHGVHGAQICNTYLISMMFPTAAGFCELQVTEGILKGFDVLIGMDVISHGDFLVTNHNGKTELHFQMPSQGLAGLVQTCNGIAHANGAQPTPPVKNQPIRAPDKPGRNDPCHCGSGKKFKHCHGR